MARDREQLKKSLELDVEELRAKLGPVKVALIERWIREVNGPYEAAFAPFVTEDAVVLDVGCSRGDPDLPVLEESRFYVGADVDMPGLRANHLAQAVVLAPIDHLPFAENTFDVVVCKWVAEHLEEPTEAFRECARILKPGGVLAILTPNALSMFTGISAILPFRLKQILKGRMFGGHEEDTFRTWYRANTWGALDRHMGNAGLTPVTRFTLPGMWTFFIFSGPLARMVRAVEHIQHGIPVLGSFSTYLVGVWRKET